MRFYLDSSALLKRYIAEKGTEKVENIYLEALNGEATLHFSVWNIGEVLGTLHKYLTRDWLGEKEHRKARRGFLTETARLIKLKVVQVIPTKSSLLTECWPIVERHHIYQADALQIVSAKHSYADQLLTGDHKLAKISNLEDINAIQLT
ncbi:MAG: type II toxin-antitoxin system VapC family toxin [Thermoproteota archaeon]